MTTAAGAAGPDPDKLIAEAVPLLKKVTRMWFGVTDAERRMCQAMLDTLTGPNGRQVAEMIAANYNPYACAVAPKAQSVQGAVDCVMFVPGDGGLTLTVSQDWYGVGSGVKLTIDGEAAPLDVLVLWLTENACTVEMTLGVYDVVASAAFKKAESKP